LKKKTKSNKKIDRNQKRILTKIKTTSAASVIIKCCIEVTNIKSPYSLGNTFSITMNNINDTPNFINT